MELKRILARDSRSANEKAIQLYGKEVLIISSQRLDNQTELIVAIDMDASGSAATAKQPERDAPAAPLEARTEAADETAFVPFSKLFQSASAFAPLPSDAAPLEPLEQLTPAPAAAVVPALPPLGVPPAVADAVQAQQARHEQVRSQEIVDMMRHEMAALRKEFSLSRQMMPWQEGLRLSPAVQQLTAAMSEAGVPAGLRALLTDSIQNLTTEHEALSAMHSLLVSALSRAAAAVPSSGVHALCGPSGAGKTSMVGRLALAAAQVQGAHSQAMVSFADQRPGAWAQMQLLAAQSGVSCYRAADSDTLRMLLEDLEGKTVWIDTCGSDFLAQAQLLLSHHPKVLRHAVLPVDATVTSVQKILQNPVTLWSSLMLSKVDEAAYPWALIKGLTEQSVPVSCMAVDSRIGPSPVGFDADRLVKLALLPLCASAGLEPSQSALPAETPALPEAPVPDLAREHSDAAHAFVLNADLDIVIPTLMTSLPAAQTRQKTASARSISKVTHG